MKQHILANIITFATSFAVTNPVHSQQQPLFVTAPDGVRIAYEVHGAGTPTIVFVHGWSCDRTYWKGQTGAFSQQFKVVAIDLAGHGESGLGRKDYTIEAFGGDVAAVVDNLGLQNVVLVGHSMGGDVIAEAARRLPGRVKGLIWLDTYKKLGTGRTTEQVEEFVGSLTTNFRDSTRTLVRSMFVSGSDTSLVKQVAEDMSSAPPEVALSALEHSFNYSRQMPHTLEELKLPVIAINPDNSPTDTTSMKHYGIEVMLMSGVGHFLMMEDPERFNSLLMIAIKKLNGRNE